MRILLTNDDGIGAAGLRALYAALRAAGHTVHVVAPMQEQSAVGHSLTVFQPLRSRVVKDGDFHGIGIHGTPTDCVKLALHTLVPERPDMVISGINAGANVGPDILYSGTVAAATEGAHSGLPALAVSHDDFHPGDLAEYASHAASLLPSLPWDKLPPRCLLNLNYPRCPLREAKPLAVCPQTSAVWADSYVEGRDPRGNPYWWLTGVIPPEQIEPGSDRDLLTRGHVTLTPLRFDFTAHASMETLRAAVSAL